MSYIDKHLSHDEKVISFFRISRLAFFGEYLLLAFVLLLTLSSLYTTFLSIFTRNPVLEGAMTVIFYILLLLSIVLLVRVEYKIWTKRYALTTKRILVSEGIFTEDFKSATYAKITDVGLKQSFWDKVLDVGTISVNTAGTQDVEIIFRKVRNPIGIKNRISQMQSVNSEPEKNGNGNPGQRHHHR